MTARVPEPKHVVEDLYGATLTATTEHAWAVPRGEVYIGLVDPDVLDAENEVAEVTVALTAAQSVSLGLSLLTMGIRAYGRPPASIDPEGAPL